MSFRGEDYAKALASGGIGIAIVAFLVIHGRRSRRKQIEGRPADETKAVAATGSGAKGSTDAAVEAAPVAKKRRWSIVDTVVVIVILGGIAWFVTAPERTAARVKIGMSKEQAIAAVGQPAQWQGAALPECQGGNTDRCRNAEKSGAVLFLKWQTFVDSELIVGICADGRVCFMAQEG